MYRYTFEIKPKAAICDEFPETILSAGVDSALHQAREAVQQHSVCKALMQASKSTSRRHDCPTFNLSSCKRVDSMIVLGSCSMAADSGIELPPIDQSHTSSFPATSTHSGAASSRGSSTTQVLTQKEVDEKPWKYIGYKGYSEFISSESDFLIFRRFAAASARIALSLQNEVSVLEQELENLDRKYSKREAEDVHNGSFREEQRDRGVVLRELHDGLVKYSEFCRRFMR